MITDYSIPIITNKTVNLSGATSTGFLYHDSVTKWLLTARHNLYPLPNHIKRLPSNDPYEEILIENLVLRFKANGIYSHGWELTQQNLLDYGRISRHQEVELAAINLTELLIKNPEHKKYYSNKSFFTANNLSKEQHDYDIGNRVIVIGFRYDYDLEHDTRPGEYPGSIIPLPPEYGHFLFAVNAFCPRGVSGSPVMLDGSSNNRENSTILLGSCTGYKFENKMGIISYSSLITEILENGVNLHERKSIDPNLSI